MIGFWISYAICIPCCYWAIKNHFRSAGWSFGDRYAAVIVSLFPIVNSLVILFANIPKLWNKLPNMSEKFENHMEKEARW